MGDLMHILMALLGLVMKNLVKLKSAIPGNKNTPNKFNLKYYLKDNWLSMSMSLISIIVMLTSKEDVKALLGLEFNYLNSFIVGYFNYDLIRSLLKGVEEKMSTKE